MQAKRWGATAPVWRIGLLLVALELSLLLLLFRPGFLGDIGPDSGFNGTVYFEEPGAGVWRLDLSDDEAGRFLKLPYTEHVTADRAHHYRISGERLVVYPIDGAGSLQGPTGRFGDGTAVHALGDYLFVYAGGEGKVYRGEREIAVDIDDLRPLLFPDPAHLLAATADGCRLWSVELKSDEWRRIALPGTPRLITADPVRKLIYYHDTDTGSVRTLSFEGSGAGMQVALDSEAGDGPLERITPVIGGDEVILSFRAPRRLLTPRGATEYRHRLLDLSSGRQYDIRLPAAHAMGCLFAVADDRRGGRSHNRIVESAWER